MIYQMRAEQATSLIQGETVLYCPYGTTLEALSFSPLINRKIYLVTLRHYPGVWEMYDPPGSGIWTVSCEL